MSITHACIVRRGEFREVLFPENLSARFESESSVLRVGNAAPRLSENIIAHVLNFSSFAEISQTFMTSSLKFHAISRVGRSDFEMILNKDRTTVITD